MTDTDRMTNEDVERLALALVGAAEHRDKAAIDELLRDVDGPTMTRLVVCMTFLAHTQMAQWQMVGGPPVPKMLQLLSDQVERADSG